jgi:hypothetical protein
LAVLPKFATEAHALTLEQAQAEAAPLLVQLLAQVILKRQKERIA